MHAITCRDACTATSATIRRGCGTWGCRDEDCTDEHVEAEKPENTSVSRVDWPLPADEPSRSQKSNINKASGHGNKAKHRPAGGDGQREKVQKMIAEGEEVAEEPEECVVPGQPGGDSSAEAGTPEVEMKSGMDRDAGLHEPSSGTNENPKVEELDPKLIAAIK